MVYHAKTQQGALVFFLAMIIVLSITNMTNNHFYEGIVYFQIVVAVFIFASIFINFKFKMNGSYLIYEILFLAIPIFKKEIYPNQIIKIKFKRIGWTTKGAIIQVKKGFNIRVVNFSPDNVFIDLIDFANENGITIDKTKDYLILEK